MWIASFNYNSNDWCVRDSLELGEGTTQDFYTEDETVDRLAEAMKVEVASQDPFIKREDLILEEHVEDEVYFLHDGDGYPLCVIWEGEVSMPTKI